MGSRMKKLFLIVIFLIGCGEDAITLKETEYFVGGEWRQCGAVQLYDCGYTLLCGETVFQCVQNVEMRYR